MGDGWRGVVGMVWCGKEEAEPFNYQTRPTRRVAYECTMQRCSGGYVSLAAVCVCSCHLIHTCSRVEVGQPPPANMTPTESQPDSTHTHTHRQVGGIIPAIRPPLPPSLCLPFLFVPGVSPPPPPPPGCIALSSAAVQCSAVPSDCPVSRLIYLNSTRAARRHDSGRKTVEENTYGRCVLTATHVYVRVCRLV